MNSIRKKMLRVGRLRVLEQSRLNSLVVELAAIESSLAQKRAEIDRLQSQVDEASTRGEERSIEQHAQANIWIEHLQAVSRVLRSGIDETELERDKMRDEIIQQKAKVRGWDTLLERLTTLLSGESQKSEALIADERYLNSRMAR